MAGNLLKAGHEVSVSNRSPGKSGSLIERARTKRPRLPRRAAGEVVITMLGGMMRRHPTSPWGRGASSTICERRDPSVHEHDQCCALQAPHSGACAGRTAPRGCAGVRAPGHGGGGQAVHRRGGDPATIDVCQPLFHAMGQKAFSIGTEPSAANLVKLSGNFLLDPPSRPSARPSRSSVRPASTGVPSGATHLHGVHRARVQNLRRPHRRRQVRAGGLRRAARIQRYPTCAGRGRESSRTHAAGQPVA